MRLTRWTSLLYCRPIIFFIKTGIHRRIYIDCLRVLLSLYNKLGNQSIGYRILFTCENFPISFLAILYQIEIHRHCWAIHQYTLGLYLSSSSLFLSLPPSLSLTLYPSLSPLYPSLPLSLYFSLPQSHPLSPSLTPSLSISFSSMIVPSTYINHSYWKCIPLQKLITGSRE